MKCKFTNPLWDNDTEHSIHTIRTRHSGRRWHSLNVRTPTDIKIARRTGLLHLLEMCGHGRIFPLHREWKDVFFIPTIVPEETEGRHGCPFDFPSPTRDLHTLVRWKAVMSSHTWTLSSHLPTFGCSRMCYAPLLFDDSFLLIPLTDYSKNDKEFCKLWEQNTFTLLGTGFPGYQASTTALSSVYSSCINCVTR